MLACIATEFFYGGVNLFLVKARGAATKGCTKLTAASVYHHAPPAGAAGRRPRNWKLRRSKQPVSSCRLLTGQHVESKSIDRTAGPGMSVSGVHPLLCRVFSGRPGQASGGRRSAGRRRRRLVRMYTAGEMATGPGVAQLVRCRCLAWLARDLFPTRQD